MIQLGDIAPPGYAWPTTDEYWQGYVQALGPLAPSATAPIGSAADILSPPFRTHVAGLVAMAEGSTGLTMGQLSGLAGDISKLATATDAQSALFAVNELMQGVVEVIAETAIKGGVEAAAKVADVVPIVGQIVGLVIWAAFAGKEYAAQAAQQRAYCEQTLAQEADNVCAALVSAATPIATRPGSPTPADLFRPLGYAYRRSTLGGPFTQGTNWGRFWPLTQASVYGLLCGDAIDTFQPLFSDNAHPRGIDVPIPKATRQRMWSIVRALMLASENPALGQVRRTAPDGGGALFAVLQDLVWREIIVHQRIDEAFVRQACAFMAYQYRFKYVCKAGSGAAAGDLTMTDSCIPRVRDGLFGVWLNGLKQFELSISERFRDPVTGAWLLEVKPSVMAGRLPKIARLVLNKRAVSMMVSATTPRRAPPPAARAAVGLGAAGLAAAAAWWLL